MAKLYSARLLGGGATASLDEVVPAGVVWVVRDAVLYFDGASSSDAYNLAVLAAAGFTAVIDAGQVAGGSQETIHWEGRQVLVEGDHLHFSASTVNWYVLVSGYVLTLP